MDRIKAASQLTLKQGDDHDDSGEPNVITGVTKERDEKVRTGGRAVRGPGLTRMV